MMVDDGSSVVAAGGVCCMCGDQGLPGELFQCTICFQRLQHRYCSNQYPRMATYSVCNWCLQVDDAGHPSPLPAARAKQRASSSSSSSLNGSRVHHHDNDDKDRPCGGGGSGSGGCSRSAFPAEPQKPVKKPMKRHEIRAAQRRPAAAKGREVQPGGARTKPPFRAKARVPRYKLLTEVIGCK